MRLEPLNHVLEEAAAAALAQDSQGIELECDVDPLLPPVPVDARLLRQALLNVTMNAVQAMKQGGKLTVRARRDGDAAQVEISDTGTGIPQEIRQRVFEPFFTTKASGTGLGLAVVKRIVEEHRGKISLSSEMGAGTTFSIRLPIEQLRVSV
jgi:two-component system sensor histidine kinase HydH